MTLSDRMAIMRTAFEDNVDHRHHLHTAVDDEVDALSVAAKALAAHFDSVRVDV